MKLYRVPNAPADQRWQRTQDEAKAVARQCDGGFLAVEVPTDQRGLVAWLNERTAQAVARGATLVDHAAAPSRLVELHADCPPSCPEKTVVLRDPAGIQPDVPLEVPRPTQAHTARSITDFILDEATVAQVENVLACLGTRVAELAKGARAA